ncbi:MAG: hypothetical protein NZ899_02625 [Thermoguttaceae bacterium]|nr:hypothetical protein [Thermoguttaceae bacterium]MDW8079780.1 hypothetical protein [Thermoguttaceae bacterium]
MSTASSSRKTHALHPDKPSDHFSEAAGSPSDCFSQEACMELPSGQLETTFFETIAEQLAQSLEIIRNYSELVYERHVGELEAEACRHLRLVMKACDRAEELVDWLRAFCHAGRSVPNATEIDLDRLLSQLRKDSRRFAPAVRELSVSHPLTPVIGDAESVTQLFSILLSLARDFYTGQRCLAEIAPGEDSSMVLRLIPDEPRRADRLLKPLKLSPVEELKLAIALRLVRANQGKLQINTDSAGIIEFVLTLPQKGRNSSAVPKIRPPHWVVNDSRGKPSDWSASAGESAGDALETKNIGHQ